MLSFSPSPACRTETLGAVAASSRGTLITANASANTKGTAVSLGTPAFPYRHILLSIASHTTAADYLVDLCVGDPAGTGYVLVPDLHCGSRYLARINGLCLSLPLSVGTGAALYARCQCATGSATCAVAVAGFSAGIMGGPGFSRVVALFTSPGSSKGASLAIVASGGAWTQVSAGVTSRVGGVFALLGDQVTQASGNSCALRVRSGAAGSEASLIDPVGGGFNGNVFTTPKTAGPVACDLPASTPIAAQLVSSGTGTGDLAVYGLVI